MMGPYHQDGTVPGVLHDIFHESADHDAAIFLWQWYTHDHYIKFASFNLFNDFLLGVSNFDLTLSGHSKHLEAFHAATDESFRTLTLVIIFEITTQRRK